MTIRDEIKKQLSIYSKEELIKLISLSQAATAFVLKKGKALYGDKKAPVKHTKEIKDNDRDK